MSSEDPAGSDPLTDLSEKEILIEIFRQVRWIARAVTVALVAALLGAGLMVLVQANDNANDNARDLVECLRQGRDDC